MVLSHKTQTLIPANIYECTVHWSKYYSVDSAVAYVAAVLHKVELTDVSHVLLILLAMCCVLKCL